MSEFSDQLNRLHEEARAEGVRGPHELMIKRFPGISTRTRNLLARAGLSDRSALLSLSDAELLKVRNLGRASLRELRANATAD